MQNKQRYITAAGTIAAAALTAHIMQRDASPSNPNPAPPVNAAAAASVAAPNAPAVASERTQNPVTVVNAAAVQTPEPPAPATEAEAPVELAAAAVVTPAPTHMPQVAPAPVVTEAALTDPSQSGPEGSDRLPADIAVPAPLPDPGAGLPDRVEATADTPVAPVTEQPQVSAFGLSCGPILSAAPVGDGLVTLTLTAPCRDGQRFDVRHGPLSFTAMTDDLGAYQMTAPALMTDARFSVTFEDGETVEASAEVDGVDALERVALVAEAASGFQIHALEFGADYGEAGHIWLENPGTPSLAAMDGQGYLLQLGDPKIDGALISQVYTFPRDGSSADGVVRLSVEAEVTARNCSREVAGQSIERGPSGVPISMSMTVAVPDCDAIGEYLVLKNILRDLRIASSN